MNGVTSLHFDLACLANGVSFCQHTDALNKGHDMNHILWFSKRDPV